MYLVVGVRVSHEWHHPADDERGRPLDPGLHLFAVARHPHPLPLHVTGRPGDHTPSQYDAIRSTHPSHHPA